MALTAVIDELLGITKQAAAKVASALVEEGLVELLGTATWSHPSARSSSPVANRAALARIAGGCIPVAVTLQGVGSTLVAAAGRPVGRVQLGGGEGSQDGWSAAGNG